MRRVSTTFILATLLVSTCLCAAQQIANTSSNPSVPNLIRYGGLLKDAQGVALGSAATDVTFAVYKQPDGGSPVWTETQRVTTDASGNYSILLGSTTAGGLPGDLFSQQEQRWLGVQIHGEDEQARVLLASVPYAFKAHEADTLGGLPASAFMKAAPGSSSDNSSANPRSAAGTPPPPGPVVGGDGTANFIPIWTTRSYLLSSVIYQSSGGNVGVGTTQPAAKLDVKGNISTVQAYQIDGNNVLSIGSADDQNSFLGIGAGAKNVADLGQFNAFTGSQAGFNNTSGSNNTFTGYGAGYSNTAAGYNTFTGYLAGENNTGDYNSFFGAWAGPANTTGRYNNFFGYAAGASNTTGAANTFIGEFSGTANTGGDGNLFLGSVSGYVNTTGTANTFVGNSAGIDNVTGGYNIFIGFGVGEGVVSGSRDIFIGSRGILSPENESDTVRIGNAGHSATYIAGIYSQTSSSGIPVYINSYGKLGTLTSSLRFKEQVRDMGDRTDALMKLRPVTFLYKPEYDSGERTLQYGLIAEEVAKVYPELVAYDNDGKPYTVRYQYIATMLLNEVQKQRAIVASQREEIEGLKQQLQLQNASLQDRLTNLEAHLAAQLKAASQNPPPATLGTEGGAQ